MRSVIELPIPVKFTQESAEDAIGILTELFEVEPDYFLVHAYSRDEYVAALDVARYVEEEHGLYVKLTADIPRGSWMLFGENGKCVYSSGAG